MPGAKDNLIDSLRNYILDLPEFNDLNFNEEELDENVLGRAIDDGIVRYDLIPPSSSTDIEILESNKKLWYFIKRCAAIEAIQSLIFLHVRNRNPVADVGGVQVDEMNKAPDWDRVKQTMIQEIETRAQEYKRILSLMSMPYGVISMSPGA